MWSVTHFCRMTFNIEMSDCRDIALHFDVRFKYGSDKHAIVRNAKPGTGGWGSEERSLPFFPFVPNMFFEIMILVEYDRYKVSTVLGTSMELCVCVFSRNC